MHSETDTFTTTYAAIDPLHPDRAAVTLDGFFGWPLSPPARVKMGLVTGDQRGELLTVIT